MNIGGEKMNSKEYFYTYLQIKDEDKERAERALYSKGVQKHILIKKKLSLWRDTTVGECVKYTQIATAYRYDKRIRLVLFKYISYLEEFYRAKICDAYFKNTKQKFWTIEMQEKLKCNENDMDRALEHLDFAALLEQCKKCPQKVKKQFAFPHNHFDENVKALIRLRNAVMHNKFLLLYRGLGECYIDGIETVQTSLSAHIINLISFLPTEVGEKCKTEINACKIDRNEPNETEWDLPDTLVLNLDIKQAQKPLLPKK